MVYDDIIIGSGLTALATAYGLPEQRKVLVLSGGQTDQIGHYDQHSRVPRQNIGLGGLGNFWHGVIPMHSSTHLSLAPLEHTSELLHIFYPHETIEQRINKPWLFVPHKPIRPKAHWDKLSQSRAEQLEISHTSAQRVRQTSGTWTVDTCSGELQAQRLWIAAGALGTAALLERSHELSDAVLPNASDHAILYLGQTDRKMHPQALPPEIKHSASGYWMKSNSDFGDSGLITAKPARFDYKILDQGIEQRSAFGLPTSGVIKKLMTASSPGFIAEALFNKFGLFPNSDILSLYAQIRLKDAYCRETGRTEISANVNTIRQQIQTFRDTLKLEAFTPSQRPELYIRGIHLHRTLDSNILNSLGINTQQSNCSVIDASAVDNIGAEHHSFRLMTKAYHRAKTS